MNSTIRRTLFFMMAPVFLGFLIWGVGGLAPFGHYPGPYGDILNAVAVKERHATNVVASVIFDYRGFDTLGEEYILFASVTGVVLLLRHQEEQEQEGCDPESINQHPVGVIDPQASDLTRLFSLGFIAAILIFGVDTVLTGHLGPGGGFQGGVIISAAWLLILVAYGSRPFRRCTNVSLLEWFESAGAAAYIFVGAVALVFSRPFLTNIFPLGHTGHLLSSGGILLINCAVGVEVTAGFVIVIKEFVRPLEEEKPVRGV